MKNKRFIFSLIFVLHACLAWATDYYISNSGSNNNAGTSPALAWATLSKVETEAAAGRFQPGDRILLERGGYWNENLILSNINGTGLNRIFIGTYGSGALPVIDVARNVSGWTPHPTLDNVYYADIPSWFTNTYLPGLMINEIFYEEGREPNAGEYLDTDMTLDQTFLDNGRIVDPELQDWLSQNDYSNSYWDGAEIVVYSRAYIIDTTKVKNIDGSQINFTGNITYGPFRGSGYFFRKSLKTLDQSGEWYFDRSLKRLFLYWQSDPTGNIIRVPYDDTGLSLSNSSYVTIQGLNIKGAREQNVLLNNVHHVAFIGNDVELSGKNGLVSSCNNCKNSFLTIASNNIHKSQNNGIEFEGDLSNLSYNRVDSSGVWVGMGKEGTEGSHYVGVRLVGINSTFDKNVVTYSGYNAIHFSNGPWYITNNIVDYYNIVKVDGGGIYTYNNHTRTVISDNSVLNGVSSHAGMPKNPSSAEGKVMGIYLDGRTSNTFVLRNLVHNTERGVQLNQGSNVTIRGNVITGITKNGVMTSSFQDGPNQEWPTVRNHRVTHNYIAMADDNRPFIYNLSGLDDVELFGTYANNTFIHALRSTARESDIKAMVARDVSADEFYTTPEIALSTNYGDGNTMATGMSAPRYSIASGTLVSVNPTMDNTFGSGIWVENTFTPGYNSADFSVSRITSGGIDGATLRARWESAAPVGSKADFYQRFIPVTADQYYRISFDARASKTGYCAILFKHSTSDQIVYFEFPVQIATTTQNYSFVVQSPETYTDGRLMFMPKVTEPGGIDFYFDNIRVEAVSPTIVNNFDDVVRVEYNDTTQPKTVNLTGSWRRLNGTTITNANVILQPYTYQVFFKVLP